MGIKIDKIFATTGPFNHFFGYYDKSPFDNKGQKLLCHRTNFDGRNINGSDKAEIGFWDIKTGSYHKLAETKSFNWQQGSMLQWYPPRYSDGIIYNDYIEGDYRAIILNINDGSKKILHRPIYSLSSDGQYSVTVDFKNLFFSRPGYSYCTVIDKKYDVMIPENQGVFLLDIFNDKSSLIISTKDMYSKDHDRSMDYGYNYLEHLMFNPSGKRFMFYHRWQLKDGGVATRVYTADKDGKKLFSLPDSRYYTHACWRDDNELLIWGRNKSVFSDVRNSPGILKKIIRPLLALNRHLADNRITSLIRTKVTNTGYLLCKTFDDEIEHIGKSRLLDDGHPSFCPGNRNLFVSDTYPDSKGLQRLYLYDLENGLILEEYSFNSKIEYNRKGFRCDLHPRFDINGKMICVDSLDSGTRQMLVFELNEF